MIGFPERKLISLNKTDSQKYAHVSARYGQDDMLGYLNVFHQLHCLVRIAFFFEITGKIASPEN